MFITPTPCVTQGSIMWTFCWLQYVTFQLLTETSSVKNVTLWLVSPRSVTKMHHSPCCSLHTPSIYPSILHAHIHFLCPPPLRSHGHTISSIISLLLHIEAFFSPHMLSSFPFSSPSNITTIIFLLIDQLFFIFTQLSPSSFHIFPCLYHPFFHPTPLFSASLNWQVLWE